MIGMRIGRIGVLMLALTAWSMVVIGPTVKHAVAQEDANKDKAKEGQPHKAGGLVGWFWIIGLIGWFILCLNVYFVATIGRLFVEMRADVAMPPEIVDQCEDLLQARNFKEIYTVVKDDDSFFSRILSTGIAELPNGLAEARESMERVGESVTVEMEKKISILAVMGSLGPMIGLLGTLKGMISSFSVIAEGSGLDPSRVAEGISEALWLTLLGVGLAVPAIYFYALFRNRTSSISVQTMLRADQFLRHFAHAARSKAPAAAAAAKPLAKA